MEYFYIASSIASLIAFVGYLIDRILYKENMWITRILIGAFMILVLGFWTWFYLAPSNPVREKIAERSLIVESYGIDNNERREQTDIVEGMFEATSNSGRIFLPPFQEPPDITLFRFQSEKYNGIYGLPEIVDVTADYFDYNSLNRQGKYVFRARGKLLLRLQSNFQNF